APKDVIVTPLSTASIKVTVVPPDDATNILRYDVFVPNLGDYVACAIEAGNGPLECEVGGLFAGRMHTVRVHSWVEKAPFYSEGVEGKGWTKPNGPRGVNVITVSSSSLKVVVMSPSDPSSISQYKIAVKGTNPTKSCVVDAKTEPLECTLDGLTAGTKYTVVACSWNATGRICSDSVESFGWTKPNGKFTFSFLFVVWNDTVHTRLTKPS
uniref:Fibronectin type-III domain-containing protein n=1 Tax=Mesocestoides corti TaxID=53468 RepID=A0A5K3G030_MESCO